MENVEVRVSGRHRLPAGEQETIQLMAQGTYRMVQGHHCVKYSEVGTDGETWTLLRFRQDFLELTRKGRTHSYLRFEMGRRTTGVYGLQTDGVRLEIDTAFVRVQETETVITVHLQYQLEQMQQCDLMVGIARHGKPLDTVHNRFSSQRSEGDPQWE